ncbi:uncharacterized protein LOC103829047 [Brassica rapa]|uniref:uncharacterized protein LOC103829047 n=1 Tax=Brassica campestris TaxID=3711 RepID=UPI0004F1C255|nr:uncharacterized protein LOC103829047 [Brassica rapa]XP_009102954.1 uncharacterized protein LOC103829047 [Brassica rapa]XP_018508828.1 uncharacterized protein LOC103829047 [Brassica rapa]
MVEIYSVCGKWKLNDKFQWEFLVDSNKGGSLSEVDENVTYIDLVETIIEDFGLGCLVKDRDITLSYELPPRMKIMVKDSPPVYIRNDRQVRTFISKIKGNGELIRLCVTVNDKNNTIVVENVGNNTQSKTIHNEENADVDKTGCIPVLENLDGGLYVNESNVHEEQQELYRATRSDMSVHVTHNDTCSTTGSENHPLLLHSAPYSSPVSLGCSQSPGATNDLHVNKYFKDKQDLMLTMRKLALESKFQFKSRRSNKSRVVLGCVDDKCCWRMRATKHASSDFFVVKNYVHEHTCDPTHRNASNRQASAKLLGSLICSKYGENKDGLKPKQIMEQVRKEHGLQIKYKQAWRVKEYAQNLMRGIPDSVTETSSTPPTNGQSSERPSKKRMRSVRDFGTPNSESRKYNCSKCGEEGHNKSTCKVPK